MDGMERRISMLNHPFHRLAAVSACLRNADQLMVAAVPLIAAAVFKLPENQIGAMVAAQGSAWLLMSIPAGVLVDRMAPLDGMKRALVISPLGFALAVAGLALHAPMLFTFGAFLTACAVVLGFLAESASLQRLVQAEGLGTANARMQIIQSTVMIIGPAVMGFLVARDHALVGLLLGLMLGLAGLALTRRFEMQEAPPPRQRQVWADVREGFEFVRGQPLLRGIVACALFWNAAFMGLAAIYVPFALKRLAMDADGIGLAQAAMGVGSLVAAFTAGLAMTKLPPRYLLFFGPASSTVAVVILYFAPNLGGAVASIMMYLLLGFGPILWFVCQNTIRQLVTPRGMLGRVGAVIQLAIYGVRSLGALFVGWVASGYDLETAVLLVITLFALSTLTIPLSELGKLSAMPHSEG
jgi:predicted MFS family arabinose efflux permease